MQEQLLQPVTYGSVIYLSLENNLQSFLFSDGFVDQSVRLRSLSEIDQGKDYYDFSFCLFMVLPFSNDQVFEQQRIVIAEWKDKLLNSQVEELRTRKEQVTEMQNKLQSEFQFNQGLIQKSIKQSVCFGSSNFMLLHINSMKFLSLERDNNNNLFLKLIPDPSDSCFFNFDPSLKLQKGRSDNFVYEDEIVYIACTKKFSGKSPYLSLLHNSNDIIGLIDAKENWKVNIYEEPYSDNDYMRIGSQIWILSSEQPCVLCAERDKDPFLELYNYLPESDREKDKYKHAKEQDPTKKLDSSVSKYKEDSFLFNVKQSQNLRDEFLRYSQKHMTDSMHIKFENIRQTQPGPFGLWKIESTDSDKKKGGEMRWDQHYIFKHIITGKYLTLVDLDGQKTLTLTSQKDQTIEFQFHPILNLLSYKSKERQTSKITKDAFFMLQHVQSQQWIGFEKEQPVMFEYTKDVNTFRFREASEMYIWETYTITASQQLLLRQVEYSLDGLEMASMTYPEHTDIKAKFDSQYQNVLDQFQFFEDFLLNRQVQNLNVDLEIMKPCKLRQDRFLKQFQLGLLLWMVIQIFPTSEEFEQLDLGMHHKKPKNPNQQKRTNPTANFKLAQEHVKSRYAICLAIYRLMSFAALDNQHNQEFIRKFFKSILNHVGFNVSESLRLIFQDNKKMLEEIHREKLEITTHEKKLQTDVFQFLAHKLNGFQPYMKTEILELMGSFIGPGIYINQEKLFTAIVENKNFLFGHLMKFNAKDKSILVEYRVFVDKEYETQLATFEELFNITKEEEKIRRWDDKMKKYFIEQMRLYSRLCQHRNYVCVKNLQELLPQSVLLDQLAKVTDSFKEIQGTICQLLINLYVDVEPRSMISKPSYVRVYGSDNDITTQFIRLNLRDDVVGSYKIRKYMMEYLNITVNKLNNDKDSTKTPEVYNELTYEVIKALSYMIKFGLFTNYANERFQLADQVPQPDLLDQLIILLTRLLEYDPSYYQELAKNEFKWKYAQIEKKEQNNLSNVLGAPFDLFKKKEEEEEEEEKVYKKEDSQQSQSYQFLKRYESLLKLIHNFTNKTYRSAEFELNVNPDYFVLIKKQVSLIFSELLSWREDYYIQNALKFFQDHKEITHQQYMSLLPVLPVNPGKFKKQDDDNKRNPTEEIRDFDVIIQRPFVEILLVAFYFARDSDLQNQIANLIHKRYTQRSKFLKNMKRVSLVEQDNNCYQVMSTNMNDLKNNISSAQSWLQIIESNIYDEKAEEILRQTEIQLHKLLTGFKEDHDPEQFLIRQKIFKHLGGHKLLLKFIRQGTRVIKSRIDYFQIDGTISADSYKSKFIDTVKRVFNVSHQILSKFVESEETNKKSVFKHFQHEIEAVNLNIGQVDFLRELFRGAKYSAKRVENLMVCIVNLIKQHGHYRQFLELILIVLETSDSELELREIILTMVKLNYHCIDPQNEHPERKQKQSALPPILNNPVVPRSKYPPYYPESIDNHKYTVMLITIVHRCLRFKYKLPLHFYVDIRKLLTVDYLIHLLHTEVNKKQQNIEFNIELGEILEQYFLEIDGAINQFQECIESFVEILEVANVKQEPQYGTVLIRLVRLYFRRFLKDIGLISLKSLCSDEKIQYENKLFNFAERVRSIKLENAPPAFLIQQEKLIANLDPEKSRDIDEKDDSYEIDKTTTIFQKQHLINGDKNIQRMKSQHLQEWENFVHQLVAETKKQTHKETLIFPEVLVSIHEMFAKPDDKTDERLKQLLLSKDDIITAFLKYIEQWETKQAQKQTILFLLKSIRIMSQEGSNQAKRQIHLDSLGATEIALRLYWKDRTEDQYAIQLIKWLISLLEGGNKIIQMNILQLMRNDGQSEQFFNKVNDVLNAYMVSIKGEKKVKKKLIQKTLTLIQLLCEGHNTHLQNYLRQQTNSKVSYDLVSLMVKLVISNAISDDSYEAVLQCLDTLTEVVQGPCKENQVIIVSSKFISWAMDLLMEDPKIFKKDQEHLIPTKLNRLKYKCTATLLSLMETQENNVEIMNIMTRSIPVPLLITQLGFLYMRYEEVHKKEYLTESFNTLQVDIEGLTNEEINNHKSHLEIIVEYGFNLVILINILLVDRQPDDLLLDVYGQEKIDIAMVKTLSKKQKEGYEFFYSNTVKIEILRDDDLQRIFFPLLPQCKQLPKEQKRDFHDNVDHSSIRDKLSNLMNKADFMRKVMDHEEVLRNLFKRIKIIELVATHKALWENLSFVTNIVLNITILVSYSSYSYTETLPKYSNPDFDISTHYDPLWAVKNQQYYATTQVAWSLLREARLFEPRLFFYNERTWTIIMINILGYLNLAFSLLVIFFFAIKRAPLMITDMWVEFLKTKMHYTKRFVQGIYMILKSFVMCLVDFDFAYYCGYMACIILGIIIHPFIYVFLLVDFLRIETLTLVMKAIWISKMSMFLSFLVFVLVEYYFTILGYIYFFNQFKNDTCSQVWRCLLETFDQTFKNGGAIGDYLMDPEVQFQGKQQAWNYDLTEYQQDRYLYRFFYDVLFKFILVFLIINMVAGIIIDTFGALKDSMLEKKSFLQDYCFICGIETEKLDKSTKLGKEDHIRKCHYIWNYVFYKVYILSKPTTELSGNETYVKRMLLNNEIDWFPMKRAIGYKDDDQDDDEQSELPVIQDTYSKVQNLEMQMQAAGAKIKLQTQK